MYETVESIVRPTIATSTETLETEKHLSLRNKQTEPKQKKLNKIIRLILEFYELIAGECKNKGGFSRGNSQMQAKPGNQ